jgi:YidC/Oxa1 family membrane protein insertase
MSAFLSAFAHLVGNFADLLQPLFHGGATAAAIILFTACVRLAVHPLSRASARGQKARTRLAPQLAELRKKHAKNPERMQKAIMELHKEEQVSPLSGCLPSLLQLPAFFLLYHVFSNRKIGGSTNGLLDHSLFAAPLGNRFTDVFSHGGIFGGAGLVYVALFVIVAGVATFNYGQVKKQMANSPTSALPAGPGGQPMAGMGAMTKMMPLMSFATLFTVGFVPLAAALYVVTSTTWTAVERYFLYYRGTPATKAAETAPKAEAKPGLVKPAHTPVPKAAHKPAAAKRAAKQTSGTTAKQASGQVSRQASGRAAGQASRQSSASVPRARRTPASTPKRTPASTPSPAPAADAAPVPE